RGKCGSSGAQLGLLAVICLTFTAVVFYYILIQPAGAMGRFLFPALPAFACIVALGLARLAPQRWNGLVGAAMAVGMAALACYALFGVLRPAFARPAQVDARELANAPHQLDVQFGDVARLVGYEVSTASVKPGGELVVRVYWQALRRTEQQHVVFAHLLSDAGPMIAQRDTYPGLGRYPTTVWEPGFTFVDTYRVHVPETAYAPDIGYLQVGLYREDGPRLMTDDGEDAVRLQPVEITPLSGAVPNPLEVNFGDRILLAGYSLDRRNAHPGETISLTLYWRALAPMDVNYSVFAHILGAEDQVWGQDDGWPNHGDAPTSVWQTGDLTEDHRQLVVGLTTPPGFYDIEVGLYDAEGNRLPILADDGRWLDNRVLLSRIQVVSP
ncbi:MAG: hypothetical protein GX601_10365, partial [Anaerolineales bacterium]|nr:hypothetical protein [Anaerolineales bacterium]